MCVCARALWYSSFSITNKKYSIFMLKTRHSRRKCYRHTKQTQPPGFKSWIKLFAFHSSLMLIGKA